MVRTVKALLWALGAAAALWAAGCTKKVYVPVERVRVLRDTLYGSRLSADTLVVRDSVVLDRGGDTVRERRVRELWRLRTVRDTVRSASRDTVSEPRVVEAPGERPRSFRVKAAEAAGWSAAGALAALAAVILFRVYARRAR